MSRFTVLLALVSVLCLLAALLLLPAPRQTLPVVASQTEPPLKSPILIAFQDVSLDWGVIPTHTQSSEHLTSLTETLGSGVCAFDFNKDGWMDLFFVGGSGHNRHYGRKVWWNKVSGNRLLLNINGQHFQDITKQAGLDKRIWGMGCTVADFNNDGLTDLLITGVGSNLMYKNQGDGSFIDVTPHSGISNDHWSTGASPGDFNHDGLIDIYITNYILYKKGSRTFERTSGFQSTTNVAFDPTLYDPEPNRLYLNKGNFMFEEIASEAGVSNSLGRSLGARWADLNHDKWADLLVINDHNSPNQVFINNNGQGFSRGKEDYAPFEVAGAHDLIIHDFNNNGQDDFFMSRGMSHPPVLLSNTLQSHVTGRNTDKKAKSYTDTAWSHGLAQAKLLPFTAWGSTAGDFNNDGWLDIYIANGMILPDIDSHFVPQAQGNSLFINQGNGHFHFSSATTQEQYPYSSRGVISVDLNNDGKLEVIVTNNNNPLQIFENKGNNKHHWLGLDLLSNNLAADVYGTKVELTTNQFTIKRTLQASQNFLSMGDPRIHIGLGESKVINKLTVYWHDGQISLFENIKPDQYFIINKADNTITPKLVSAAGKAVIEPSLDPLSDAALINLSEALLLASPEKVAYQLSLIWQNSSARVRQSILSLIEQNWDHHYLSIVRKALMSSNADTVLIAIKILKKAELESSIVWLIPLLNNTNSQIQCATANTFRFFFDEEEAVTHRKKLSIPTLIRLLESGPPETKVCAANALASAENKRAISPLLKLATWSESEAVRISSVRALGLIRDTSARDNLVRIVKNQKAKASVIASALIALNRLNEPQLTSFFDSLFIAPETSSLSSASIIKNYKILTFLFAHPDGIVFHKNQLERQLTQLLRDNILSDQELFHNGPEVILAALQTIKAGKIEGQFGTVKTHLTHPIVSVRLQTLDTLMVLNTPSAKRQLEKSLLKEPLSTISKVIVNTEKPRPAFSDKFLQQLAKYSVNETQQFESLINILTHLSKQSASKLFNNILSKNLKPEQYLALFNLCSAGNIPPPMSELVKSYENITQQTSTELRYAYASCYFSDHSKTIASNNITQLKRRITLNHFMTDPMWNENHKNALLLKAAESDPVIAKTMLLNKIKTLTSSQQDKTLRILGKHGLTSNMEPLLWTFLKNQQETNKLRLQAAIQLMPNNEDDVINYLNSHFINYVRH